MSAKDQIRELINGLDEAECQRLLDGLDVYGPGAFDLSIYDLAEAAKRAGALHPPVEAGPFIRDVGEWMDKVKRTDTPILNMLRGVR